MKIKYQQYYVPTHEVDVLTGEVNSISSSAEGDPNSMETLSYASGVRRVKKKPVKKKPNMRMMPAKRTAMSSARLSSNRALSKARGKSGVFSGVKKKIATRQKQKAIEAKNREKAVKQLNQQTASMRMPEMPVDEKKGMSTGMKVGIAAGVVVVLGVIGFAIYKLKK
jgi:hypothetical protein